MSASTPDMPNLWKFIVYDVGGRTSPSFALYHLVTSIETGGQEQVWVHSNRQDLPLPARPQRPLRIPHAVATSPETMPPGA